MFLFVSYKSVMDVRHVGTTLSSVSYLMHEKTTWNEWLPLYVARSGQRDMHVLHGPLLSCIAQPHRQPIALEFVCLQIYSRSASTFQCPRKLLHDLKERTASQSSQEKFSFSLQE